MSRPIILVPGFGDNRQTVGKLAAYLSSQGLDPCPISPQPSTGTVGIDVLAHQLAGAISAAFAPDQRIDLFGFSMGGLIGRYYLQYLEGAQRTCRFVTLATPHRGTWMSYIFSKRQPATLQMQPGSPFLTALNADLSILEQLDFTSMWTPFDLTIIPPSSSLLPVGKMRRVLSPFHGLLLQDTRVLHAVAACFRSKPSEDGGGKIASTSTRA